MKYIKTPKDAQRIMEINQTVCKIDDDELNNLNSETPGIGLKVEKYSVNCLS